MKLIPLILLWILIITIIAEFIFYGETFIVISIFVIFIIIIIYVKNKKRRKNKKYEYIKRL
jgi:positive regulator of sigma E activity